MGKSDTVLYHSDTKLLYNYVPWRTTYESHSRHSYYWDRSYSFFQWVPWGRIPPLIPYSI